MQTTAMRSDDGVGIRARPWIGVLMGICLSILLAFLNLDFVNSLPTQ